METNPKKLSAAKLLSMSPLEIPDAVRALDDVDQLALIQAVHAQLLARGRNPTRDDCLAWSAMFGAPKRGMVKIAGWSRAHADCPGDSAKERLAIALHPHTALHVLGVFNMPMGEAGIGMVPTPSEQDRADIEAMGYPNSRLYDPAADPSALLLAAVTARREAGLLGIDETIEGV